MIIPDFVANAGGVISSYAEHRGLGEKTAFKLIEEKVTQATRMTLITSRDRLITPREAALAVAKERVRKAMRKRKSVFI